MEVLKRLVDDARISASKMAAVCVIVADANSVGLRMQRRPGLGAHLLAGASGGLAAGAKGRGMGSVQVGDADRVAEELWSRLRDAEHESKARLQAAYNLSWSRIWQGKCTEAERIFRIVRVIRMRIQGADSLRSMSERDRP